MSNSPSNFEMHEEQNGVNQVQESENIHYSNRPVDAAAWPTANTSTSPQMLRMEIQKGERDTTILKK